VLPCVLHEDEHLLVVNKPAGLNTHAPSPYAGEGIYEWLRHREPRWGNLATIHRLDKETSGVLVFSKSSLANRSLTAQFAKRAVRKRYVLLTDRLVTNRTLSLRTAMVRVGDRYVSRPLHTGADIAETHFRVVSTSGPRVQLEAEPLTGRTHQIRVHAAEAGFPILGDTLYGGGNYPRVCLHAAEITLQYPATALRVTFRASVDFDADPRVELRTSLVDPELTDAFRLVHGASDGWPGWYVDRLGDFLLSQAERPAIAQQQASLNRLAHRFGAKTVAHKILNRQIRRAAMHESSPRVLEGVTPAEHFSVRENGVEFELSFHEGYSVGLFLDQRDNRRRLRTGHIAAGFPLAGPRTAGLASSDRPEILNTFAYTCGFSVCAALGGVRTTSLDLSHKYLDWGKRNFLLNGIDPADHDFIYGDYFEWTKRFTKKGRMFDGILLDPPTFSQSKFSGIFRADKDYGKLIQAALPLLRPEGVLFCSTNAADWAPQDFLKMLSQTIAASGRRITAQHYVPQPPDFPVSRQEPAYLKTAWLRVD
jgi:23S rRNA (cytosine1962-C5)-methyltransferase